ncbi:hypothetical protein NE237_025522 [Protea cynaroides]|uniref:Retrotransposon gag domain-containing protein n=1 Tax=Protea cynaroides TaxID=273540 RepID=A0A9Q0K076_9MAGN|nr:hypothetical protein NE237_025522 [Protea cynaroides]
MQTTTVVEYQSQFETLSNRTDNIPTSFLASCFISGLQSDIRNEVLAFRLTTLSQAVGLARLQESKIFYRRKYAQRSAENLFSKGPMLLKPAAAQSLSKGPLLPTPPCVTSIISPTEQRIPIK